MDHPRSSPEPEPVAIVRAWCRAAGPEVARAAYPRGLIGGRLQIAVSDGHWLRELEGHRGRLLERLRREQGASGIREIEILLDPSDAPKSPPAPRQAEEPTRSREIPQEILSAAAKVPDRDLGHRLARAAAALLARSEKARSSR